MNYPVTLLCRVMQVSTSGFYAWRKRPSSERARRRACIEASVKQVHEQSHGIYGSRKIADELAERDDLADACRNTVVNAMKALNIQSCATRKFKPTTTRIDPSKRAAGNVLDQDFSASKPNEKWVSDITYLPTSQGFCYLAVVLDLFSRKVVGWSLSDTLATSLVTDALHDAARHRLPCVGAIHHSDRGCQYTSDDYQKALGMLRMQASMSRVGCCYDNAVCERFFWSLKHEWTNRETLSDLDAARASVFKYIHTFYNGRRKHQALGYVSPDQYEASVAA
jgi:putative transposase